MAIARGRTTWRGRGTIIDSAADASDMRRRMAAAALEMEATDGASTTRRRDIVAARPAMDPSRRLQAARDGFDHGRAIAAELAGFWR
jgi:hypothetical protein